MNMISSPSYNSSDILDFDSNTGVNLRLPFLQLDFGLCLGDLEIDLAKGSPAGLP